MPTPSPLLRPGRWVLLLGLSGCVDAYLPEVVGTNTPLLVVDGFINGNGRTRIRLSRSVSVATTTAPPPVRAAIVNIVDDQGRRYPLRESAVFGTYVSDSLLLPAARQYKLAFTLGSAATAPAYESALVPLKVTPAFDRLELVRQNGELQLLLSTHDAAAQARYYRWGFTETWEFNSAYPSYLEYRGGIIQSRITPIHTCWRTDRSSLIKQGSTAGLSQDAVRNYPLLAFSDRAERLKIRYSVLVTQAAETPEEFAYYEVLRKNTEAVGTVNDPLPSQLTGNVRRLGSASEAVLGFVSAHTLVQQRLWATPASLGLPAGWEFSSPYTDCKVKYEPAPDSTDGQPIYPPHTRIFLELEYTPTHYRTAVGLGDTIGYYGSTRFCVDCRLRGSNVKPSFW